MPALPIASESASGGKELAVSQGPAWSLLLGEAVNLAKPSKLRKRHPQMHPWASLGIESIGTDKERTT